MIVYCATRIDDGRKYVGSTTKALKLRRAVHYSKAKAGKHDFEFYRDLLKYEFEWQILEICIDEESLRKREEYWIKKLKTIDPKFGYNQRCGKGFTLSEETRQQISKSLKGRRRAPFSEETRRKMSESQRKRKIPREVRERIAASQKLAWEKRKAQTK